MKQCVFPTYQDGPGGFNAKEQEITFNAFKRVLKTVDDLVDVYYVENPNIYTIREVTNCGIAIENNKGQVYIYQAVFRHSDDQHDPFGNPPPPVKGPPTP